MIGKHQTEKNIGIIVVNERKALSTPESRNVFKTMIGKHQTETNIGIIVVNERKVLSKPERIDF